MNSEEGAEVIHGGRLIAIAGTESLVILGVVMGAATIATNAGSTLIA